MQRRKPRIALYSHDTVGLGHIRRNLLIAQALSKSPLEPNVLLLCGAPEAENFAMPVGVDCTILPSLYKEQDGRYRSRRFRMSLKEIISLRRKILLASVEAFDPDLVIVDGAPWGAGGELDSTLDYLREEGHARCVLGMRDVWDDPAVIAEEWDQKRNWDAIRSYYQHIWIYGDPTVYDPALEYQLEEDIASKLRYTGYLDQHARLEAVSSNGFDHSLLDVKLPDGYFTLCLMGGGQDGIHLAEAFANAELPEASNGILVTGPHMDPSDRQHLLMKAENKSSLRIIDFVPEPAMLLQHADCVVSMGGYNTICEIMSFRKRALVVPRAVPRKEQVIRAERLQALGILDILNSDDLEPEAITRFLERNIGKPPPRIQVNMNGLPRVVDLAESLITDGELWRVSSTVARTP